MHYTIIQKDVLQGRIPIAASSNVTLDTSALWSSPLSVRSLAPVATDKVASYGRALGDKATLYKYLNPHLILVTTVDTVHIIDSSTGTFVYTAQVPNPKAIMVENWLVYHWLTPEGYRLASVELYEGDLTLAKTFIFPSDVKALAFTTSEFGVAAKELVCGSALWFTLTCRCQQPRPSGLSLTPSPRSSSLYWQSDNQRQGRDVDAV